MVEMISEVLGPMTKMLKGLRTFCLETRSIPLLQ